MEIIAFSGFFYFILVIFTASLSGSDNFVHFDSFDGNCLFANILCNIPILRIS